MPAAPLKPVKDVVNKGAKPAEGYGESKLLTYLPGDNSGGTTDSRPAGSKAEKIPDSVDETLPPGQPVRKSMTAAEDLEVVAGSRD